MDDMALYFVSLTVVGLLGLTAFEEKGHRLATFGYLLMVLTLGVGVSLSAVHWGLL